MKALDLLVSRGINLSPDAVTAIRRRPPCLRELASDGRLRLRVNEFLSWELLRRRVRPWRPGGLRWLDVARRSVQGLWSTVALSEWRCGQAVGFGADQNAEKSCARLVAPADAAGLQVAAHAIGDRRDRTRCAMQSRRRNGHSSAAIGVEHCTNIVRQICRPRLAKLRMVGRNAADGGALRAASLQRFFLPVPRIALTFAPSRGLLRRVSAVAFSSDLPSLRRIPIQCQGNPGWRSKTRSTASACFAPPARLHVRWGLRELRRRRGRARFRAGHAGGPAGLSRRTASKMKGVNWTTSPQDPFFSWAE